MTSQTNLSATDEASSQPPTPWSALAVLAGSQLLIVLDATVVNVALTDIGRALEVSAADLQWVITAYVLTFGGFLLLGGRLADRFGRRRMFMAGLAGFGLGSLFAGLATNVITLVLSRALQGIAAAVMAPAALALLMTAFPVGRGRGVALGVWGGVSASGTALGLILGGILTEFLSWPWVFLINVPIAAVALLASARVLPEWRADFPARFDVAGAVLSTAGLLAVVYAFVESAERRWTSLSVAPLLLAGGAALVAFGRLQAVRAYALVPWRLVRSRLVVAGDVIGLILGAAIYSLFYFLSLFMGGTLGYGPVATGLAFLPLAAAIAAASASAGVVLARAGARRLIITSCVMVIGALASFMRINPDSSYLGTLLPGLVAAGLGLGLAFVALTTVAVGAAPPDDSGVAAALFNAAQQVGGALGLAILTAASTARTRTLTADGAASTAGAVTSGWSLGFAIATGLMVLALVIALVLIPPRGT